MKPSSNALGGSPRSVPDKSELQKSKNSSLREVLRQAVGNDGILVFRPTYVNGLDCAYKRGFPHATVTRVAKGVQGYNVY